MERDLISVIIPVYKVEAYLEKCVESVLSQTYENLEVILVDDGSPDNCPAVCDDLAKRDDRVKVIHKENGGQGSARNRGLDIAQGAYIGFVDSDDYIAPDMYEKLYAALVEAQADVSLCDFVYLDEAGARTIELPPLRTGVLDRKQIYERLEDGERGRYVSPGLRLCKRELFCGLRFEENMVYEDEMLAHLLYARCERIVIIADVLYFYIQHTGSTTNRPTSIRNLDSIRAIMARYDFFMNEGYRRLAGRTVRYAYRNLWVLITSVDVWRYRTAVRPYVKRVMAGLLRHMDRGVLMLGLRYGLETIRCAVAGRDEG